MFVIEHDGRRAVLSPQGDGMGDFYTGAVGWGRTFQDSSFMGGETELKNGPRMRDQMQRES
jgi:hypothetical protein